MERCKFSFLPAKHIRRRYTHSIRNQHTIASGLTIQILAVSPCYPCKRSKPSLHEAVPLIRFVLSRLIGIRTASLTWQAACEIEPCKREECSQLRLLGYTGWSPQQRCTLLSCIIVAHCFCCRPTFDDVGATLLFQKTISSLDLTHPERLTLPKVGVQSP